MADISDDFNRADSSAGLGTSSSGHSWTTGGSTIIGISTNRAYTVGANACLAYFASTGLADVDIECTLLSDDAGGIFFRGGTGGVDRGWYFRSQGTQYRLVTYDGVSDTTVAGPSGTTNANDVLRVVAVGGQIDCYLNGASLFSVSDSTYSTATNHGLQMWNFGTTRYIDDFSMSGVGIRHIATTGNTQDSTAGDNFTLLKPTGAQQGDVIIAGVCMGDTVSTGGSLPTGWTQIGSQFTTTGGNDGVVILGYRVVGASDPASWTDGVTPADADVTATITACYRGVDTTNPIFGSNGAWGLNPGTVASGDVNNTDADNWAVGFAAMIDETVQTPGRSAGDPSVSRGSQSLDSGEAVGIQLWDSAGPVATGNRSFTASESGTTDALFSSAIILQKASTDVSPAAGTATATGAANNPTVTKVSQTSATAGNATASGAAQNATVTAVSMTSAPAGTATASGAANNPTLTNTSNASAGTASATGVASAPTLTNTTSTTAGTATASGAANNPTVAFTKAADAGTATASGVANNPTTTNTTSSASGTATASGAASNPTVTAVSATQAPAGTATATAAASSPTADLDDSLAEAGTATAAGAANNPTVAFTKSVDAGTATATGAANGATTTNTSNGAAGTATASGTANNPTVAFTKSVAAGTATATGAAFNITTEATSATDAEAGTATADGVANNPTVTNATSAAAGTATATAAASNPTTDLDDTLAEAGTASATGVANNPTLTNTTNAAAGTATASGVAEGIASGTSGTTDAPAGTATASGAASNPTVTNTSSSSAGATSATGEANNPTVTVASLGDAGATSATGTANNPTVQIGDHVFVDAAGATAEAYGPEVVTVNLVSGVPASAAGTAYGPGVETVGPSPAGETSATGTAYGPVVGVGACAIKTNPAYATTPTKPQSKRGVTIKRIQDWPRRG